MIFSQTSATSWRRSLFSLHHNYKNKVIMNEQNQSSNEIKVIEELFPKGRVSILVARPDMGKTTLACHIAKQLTYHEESVLYVHMACDHIDIDTSDDDSISWKCCIYDMPCVSIEDISFVLSRRFLFDTVIIDYVELMDFVKGVECLKRSEELRAIWHFLDTVAQKKNIRVIGLSQLGIQFDATNSECLDNVLKYLKRDFVRERLIVLHRPSYYELQKDDIEPVQLITLKRIIPYTMKMTPWKKK